MVKRGAMASPRSLLREGLCVYDAQDEMVLAYCFVRANALATLCDDVGIIVCLLIVELTKKRPENAAHFGELKAMAADVLDPWCDQRQRLRAYQSVWTSLQSTIKGDDDALASKGLNCLQSIVACGDDVHALRRYFTRLEFRRADPSDCWKPFRIKYNVLGAHSPRLNVTVPPLLKCKKKKAKVASKPKYYESDDDDDAENDAVNENRLDDELIFELENV